jgi:hypothetical protein
MNQWLLVLPHGISRHRLRSRVAYLPIDAIGPDDSIPEKL